MATKPSTSSASVPTTRRLCPRVSTYWSHLPLQFSEIGISWWSLAKRVVHGSRFMEPFMNLFVVIRRVREDCFSRECWIVFTEVFMATYMLRLLLCRSYSSLSFVSVVPLVPLSASLGRSKAMRRHGQKEARDCWFAVSTSAVTQLFIRLFIYLSI